MNRGRRDRRVDRNPQGTCAASAAVREPGRYWSSAWLIGSTGRPIDRRVAEFNPEPPGFKELVNVKAAAQFLGVSRSLVYAYVERKQIPHYRMMGRAIRFRLSELAAWHEQFHVNGGIDE